MDKEDAFRLIRACFSSLEEARTLLDAQPELIHARTGLDETPLHYLAVENHLEGVRLLHERGAALDVVNEFGESPLFQALGLGNREVAEYLLDHGADVSLTKDDRTTLHAAARGGDVQLIRRVLAQGLPVDVRDDLHDTPLFDAVSSEQLEAIRLLADSGADVNARAAFEMTALHEAAMSGRTETVRLLLELGADPTLVDVKGDSPEAYARSGHHTECAEVLAAWPKPGAH